MTLLRCTLTLCCLFAFADVAVAQSAEELWTEATEEMARSEDRNALSLLQRLVAEHPNHNLTDDALFLAATLSEEKLGQPAQAKALYQTLLQDFPDSRSSLAAERRLASLDELMGADGAGAAALAAFQDLRLRYPDRGEPESLALAHRLLAEHPKWSGAYRIRLWIAESSRRRGDLATAATLFEQVRTGDAPAPALIQATLGAADVGILRGNFSRATELLDALASRADLQASDVQALRELRSRGALAASRARWLLASYLLLFAMIVLLLVVARRAAESWSSFWMQLRSPPLEVVYMVPVAVLFVAMAYTGHEEVGPAVAIISGGGVLVSWAAANAIRTEKKLNRARAFFCATAATLATLSLCYLALHRAHLLDLLNTTLVFGPE